MDLHQLLADITHRDIGNRSDETPLSQLENWDSLKGVRLVIRLEEIIGRELTEDEIGALRSVGDVRRLLRPT